MMKNLSLSLIFILSIISLFYCSSGAGESENYLRENCALGVFNGVAITNDNTRKQVDSLGASTIHLWMHWDYTEPEIFSPFLTMEEVDDEMINQYSLGLIEGIDWSRTDEIMKEYEGLNFIVGVGSGWLVDMPFVKGKRFSPDMGKDQYLAHLYLFTRSCVRRYGKQVMAWQIENEPNVAAENLIIGIREGEAWNDFEFVTKVLHTLERAVRMEDPDAWLTINFHTDLHFEKEIKAWLPLIDMVGIDAYPNYFKGDPVNAEIVLERISQIKEISQGKPVFVMETGYPSAPTELGYSEGKQSQYLETVYSEVYKAGGCGIFFYKLSTPETSPSFQMPQDKFGGLIRKDGSYKPAWHILKKYMNKK